MINIKITRIFFHGDFTIFFYYKYPYSPPDALPILKKNTANRTHQNYRSGAGTDFMKTVAQLSPFRRVGAAIQNQEPFYK